MNTGKFNKIATDIQIILGLELISLQRNASGSLINSFQHIITPIGEFGIEIKILGNSYWRVVEYGVNAENVPYDASNRSGAGNSKYINGLMDWIKTKQTSTQRGGFGYGNPMDKSKLGFVRKSAEKVNFEIKKISKIYEMEVVKLLNDGIGNENIEIII